jgi:flagellar P-ring protein precursor FlgI
MIYRIVTIAVVLTLGLSLSAEASVRVKDIVSIEGVRDNQLLGYGLVVGLNGTGDRQQTVFSTQSLSNLLRRMGVNVDPNGLRVNNVAAVIVTATLPPFATPGVQLDVTVSSIGDAASLQGGTLLLTALKAASGETYAAAQGSLSIGGFAAGGGGSNVQVNHPTVGRVPSGALVERASPSVAPDPSGFRLQLRRPDFATASRVQTALLIEFPDARVRAENSGTLKVQMPAGYEGEEVAFLARLGAVEIETDRAARVTLNERTGTVVIGSQVRIAPVAILHGSLTVQVVTDFIVSQPSAFTSGDTTVVPQTNVRVVEEEAHQGMIAAGATVEELVQALTAIGSTPRDIIAIMQSIAAAGALEAELQVM